MKLDSNNRFPLLKKTAGISLRGAFLAALVIGLSACGGSSLDAANALASLGNTGPTNSNNNTNSNTNAPSNSGGSVTAVVNLSWTAPTTRIDSTAVVPSDIGGYHIYYGTDQANLQLLADINDGAVTTFDTQALSSGTYYFAVAAYDSNGAEGKVSNVAQKVI